MLKSFWCLLLRMEGDLRTQCEEGTFFLHCLGKLILGGDTSAMKIEC